MNITEGLLIAALTLAAAYGGTWAAIRVQLGYMERDIKRAQETAERAHERIDKLQGAHR